MQKAKAVNFLAALAFLLEGKVEETHPNINHKDKGVWSIHINYFGPKGYHALVQALIYLLQRDGILQVYILIN
jgi:hypothetical protein